MAGIDAAERAGLTIKLNAVALKGVNEDEIDELIALRARPGHRSHADRDHAAGRHRRRPHRPVSAAVARARPAYGPLHARGHPLSAPAARRATCASRRPAARLGFITPLTHNFCESCNRVRLTCTGTLYMCLGQEDAADLRAPLRAAKSDHCSMRPSTRPSRASPRATTSSSNEAGGQSSRAPCRRRAAKPRRRLVKVNGGFHPSMRQFQHQQ